MKVWVYIFISLNTIMMGTQQKVSQKNIFGQDLIPCCMDPITGIFRDGYCNTNHLDRGVHVVCAIVTQEFLDYSKCQGNDLCTPYPHYNFPGLKAGDSWCLCASRWYEAYKAGKAPKIVLEATNEKVLDYIPMDVLVQFANK